jgi:hypothetical protein
MINIKVLKDCAEVSYQLPNSTKKQTKIIGISDIPGLFDTKISFDSGILPLFGTENAYGVQRIIQKDNQTLVFIQAINPFVNVMHTVNSELTATARTSLGISHIKTKHSEITSKSPEGFTIYKNIYFPNLLMMLNLTKDGRGNMMVKDSGLLCYKEAFLTDNTQLYRFPFSNTHKDSTCGKICWGSQSAQANSLAQSIGVIHSFLGAVMNHHLFDSFKIKDFSAVCSSQVLAYLALRAPEITSFPHADFNLKKVIKYNDLVNYIGQNWKG